MQPRSCVPLPIWSTFTLAVTPVEKPLDHDFVMPLFGSQVCACAWTYTQTVWQGPEQNDAGAQ